MTITIILVLFITFLVTVFNRFFHYQICPICGGVFGTWVLMLLGRILGYEVNIVILALLVGSSIGGISSKFSRIPKIFFVSLGLLLAYNLLMEEWLRVVFLLIPLLCFFVMHIPLDNVPKTKLNSKDLAEKMKDCCN